MKTMRILAAGLMAGLMAFSTPDEAISQERMTLGFGRLFSNDGLGDADDRWRTGAYTISMVRAPEWQGGLPTRFGELIEWRFRGEMIAPENLKRGGARDRRYAGVLTLGIHSHFDMAGIESSLGLDLAITGPQTKLGQLQRSLHDLIGATKAGDQVLADQIPNGIHPTLLAEFGREIGLGPTRFRPFMEAQAGVESLVRAGFDVSIGGWGQGGLMLRESVTGQRYRAVAGQWEPGMTFTLGGDTARIFDSELLPDAGATALREDRHRLRAGLAWQSGQGSSGFYGLTWLSPEFEDQREGQVVGSFNINLRF